MNTGNVVIAGEQVYAGIDEEDQGVCKNAIVIEFESQVALAGAIR